MPGRTVDEGTGPQGIGALSSSAMCARILVLCLVAASLGLASPAGAASYQDVVDLTYPTETATTFVESYDSPRSGGRVHRAIDIIGEKGMGVYAAVGGEVTWAPGAGGEPEPSYGYMLSVEGDDGREYTYVHLNNDTPGTDDGRGGPGEAFAPGVERGARVERGQLLGWMGDSGNAEASSPQLHFEISDPAVSDPYGSHRMNPRPSLEDALDRGDVVIGGGERQGAGDEIAREDVPPVERLAGPDRVGTSLALSRAAFEGAEDAVVASGWAFADAIVAGPLAQTLGGPVLLTSGRALDERVLAELERLGVERVTLVGGEGVVRPAVADRLAGEGYAVERLWGERASDTAAVVADRVWQRAGTAAGERRAVLALGEHPVESKAWPDALAAGWLGALSATPVLLVTPETATAATLASVADGVREVAVVGGTAAISEAIAGAVADEGPVVRRLAGDDRFGTALAVAEEADPLVEQTDSGAALWAATGWSYADALGAAPALAHLGGELLLVDGSARQGDTILNDHLPAHDADVAFLGVLGGPGAISQRAARALQDRLAGA